MASFRLYVGNLSWNTDNNGLWEAFTEFGTITDHIVMTDRDSGRSRGFGYITYETAEEMNAAISAMDGQELDGRPIRVNEAGPRGGQGGGYNNGGQGGGYNNRSSDYTFQSEGDYFQQDEANNDANFNDKRDISSKLYVGNLSWNTDNNGLWEAFTEFGTITDHIVMTDRDSGRSRGFGYITYETAKEMNAAISAMDGQELDGRLIRVNEAGPRGGAGGQGGGYNNRSSDYTFQSEGDYFQQDEANNDANFTNKQQISSKLYVGNLSWNTNDDGLWEAFTGFGTITDLVVMTDRETGRSRGFGYVTYETAEEMNAAISGMDGQELDGRAIRVNEATPRGGGRGRSGGGYNSGYNSRSSGW